MTEEEYELVDAPLHPFRIERLWAVVATEPDPDGREAEGMVARSHGLMMAPLLAADETRVEQIKEWAREIARQFPDRPMKLVMFQQRVDLEDITP